VNTRAALALPVLIVAGCQAPVESLPPVVRLDLEPARAGAGVGERIQLELLATRRDGSRQIVTAAARWRTFSGQARLDGAGGVRAPAPGTVVVEASWEGRTARATVSITAEPPGVTAPSLIPDAARSRPGGAVAFRAEATLTDGTERDVSTEAEWSVDPAGVARAGDALPGFVEVDHPGVAEVRARFGGRIASARLRAVAPERRAPEFPLHLSPDRRFLVDASGRPFRIHGDSAWSLVANLDDAEAERYLTDRAARGFNTLVVNLIEHRFAVAAPRNRRGQAPFEPPGDLGHPVDAYFDPALERVRRAGWHGMLVLLVPAYLGYGCPRTPSPSNEGWSAELDRTPPERCRAYGSYVGRRFGAERNVVCVGGGDCTPPPGSALERCALEVLHGIRDADSEALQTGHFRPNGHSLDDAAFAPEMALDSVYRYRTPYLGDWVSVGQVMPRGLRVFTTPGGPAGADDWLLVPEAT